MVPVPHYATPSLHPENAFNFKALFSKKSRFRVAHIALRVDPPERGPAGRPQKGRLMPDERSDGPFSKPTLLDKYKLIGRALRDRRLGRSATPPGTLKCLIEHDGPDGCFVGKATIAKWCGVDKSAVADALNRLRRHGYIDWERRWNTNKRRCHSNAYRINYGLVGRRQPNPLPEREEENATREIEEYVQKTTGVDYNTAFDVVEVVKARLYKDVPSENPGRYLWRLLREAQRDGTGGSRLDHFIQEATYQLKK